MNNTNIPLITIITVSYNAVKTIEDTIRSVLNQTYTNIEYIIIDGGSTDGTLDVIKKYQDRITYWVSEPDKGIYDAMNKGIVRAMGKWINFMNSGDTFYNEQILEEVFKDKDCDEADVIYGDVVYVYPNKEDIRKAFPLKRIKVGIPFCHQSAFVKTKLQQKYLFDTTYKICADYNFFYTLYKKGYTFKYKERFLAKYLAGGLSSDTMSLYIEEWKVSGWQYSFHFIIRIVWYKIKNLFK